MTSSLAIFFVSLLYKTTRLHVAVYLDHRNVVRTSVTLACGSLATFLFLTHFDPICDLLMNRCTATCKIYLLIKIDRMSANQNTEFALE